MNIRTEGIPVITTQQARVARKATVKRIGQAVKKGAETVDEIIKARKAKRGHVAKAKWAHELRDIITEVEVFSGTYIGTVLIDHTKRSAKNEVLSVSWRTSENGKLVANFSILKKIADNHIDFKPIVVSDHALERVIERNGQLEVNQVLQELSSPVFSMALILSIGADHVGEMPKHGEHFAIPSSNGVAIALVDEDNDEHCAIIKTWLPFSLVKGSQSLRVLYEDEYERLDLVHEDRVGLSKTRFTVRCCNTPVLSPRRIHEGAFAWEKYKNETIKHHSTTS